MIGFNELNKTRKEFNDVEVLINNSKELKSSCAYGQEINRKYLPQINKLIGKNLNQSTKADVHTWEFKDGDDRTRKYTLEISKKGIGATSESRYQIETYDSLFSPKDRYGKPSEGLIKDVIDNEKVFIKTLDYLNPKGKEIMQIIKEVRQQTNIIPPEETLIQRMFKISKEEKEFFKVATNEGLIEINDNNGRGVEFAVSVIKENDGVEKHSLFSIHDLRVSNENDFAYIMFVKNHKEDIENAMKEYINKTKKIKETWENFDEEIKQRLAKFILLERI
jgi:hypothetical protein